MESNKVIIRLYQPDDAVSINAMFTKYFPYKRDEEFWIWINRLIGGDSIIAVAEIEGKVIGHYAVVPRDVVVDGVKFHSGLGIHAVVDPEYRDKVSIFDISSVAYKEAKKKGIYFIYGFPNANYRFIQEKLERWKRVSLFNAYELDLCKHLLPTEPLDIKFTPLTEIDFKRLYHIQMLFEKQNRMMVILNNGSRNWLLRYILHPQKLYEIYEVSSPAGVEGYVVTKDYEKEGRKYRHVIDFAFEETTDITNVLESLLNKAKDEQVDCYSVWKGDSRFENAIKKIGFEPTGFDTFLGIKVLNKELDSAVIDKLTDFSNWRLVMGDTDSF